MIRDYLQPALAARFPEKPFAFLESAAPFATLEAPCVEIGAIELCDDGDEVTIYFTKLTHGHFGCYDEHASPEEKERKIASDVVDFLAAVFSDRVVLFQLIGGVADGWSCLKASESLPAPSAIRKLYVWSGPITHAPNG